MASFASTIEVFYEIYYPNDNSHVRRFSSATARDSYFTVYSNKKIFSNYKYQRVDNFNFSVTITQEGMQDCQRLGYARIRNDSGGKWFYCFINRIEYVDTKAMKLHLQLDVYQTFRWDMSIQSSFIERQHEPQFVSDGNFKNNTIDEGLDYGNEYRTVATIPINFTPIYFLVIVSTKPIGSNEGENDEHYVGAPTPLFTYAVPFEFNGSRMHIQNDVNTFDCPSLGEILSELQEDEDIVNSIVSMYTTLYTGIPFHEWYNDDTNTIDIRGQASKSEMTALNSYAFLYIPSIHYFEETNFTIENIYDYIPSLGETKLYMYPYTVFLLTDRRGNQIELKPEHLDGFGLNIRIKGSLGTQNKIAYYASNYLGNTTTAYDKSVLIDENPNNVPIVVDATADYIQGNMNQIHAKGSMAKQQNTLTKSLATLNASSGAVGNLSSLNLGGLASTASGYATDVANSAFNYYGTIKNIQAKQADIANEPPNAGNMSGNTQFEWGNSLVYPQIVIKSTLSEYQRRLGDYFNLYGYQINRVGYPADDTRKYWNYSKVANLNVKSTYNREYVEAFKRVYENGVTFWHTDDMYNYSLENVEV